MELDSIAGVYYDHARDFISAIGRFLSQDPTKFKAGDTNLYRYAKNDSPGATDPSGLWSERGSAGGQWGGAVLLGFVGGAACIVFAAPVMAIVAGVVFGAL